MSEKLRKVFRYERSAASLSSIDPGSVITPNSVTRLIKIHATQPKLQLTIRVEKNDGLVEKFRKEIRAIIDSIFQHRMKTKIYRGLFFDVRNEIGSVIDEFLADAEMTMTVYKMLFMIESSGLKRSILFFKHPIQAALFAVGMILSPQYNKLIMQNDEWNKSRLLEVFKVGMFHNYGALASLDRILKNKPEDRFDLYIDANKDSSPMLDSVRPGKEVIDAIGLIQGYYTGRAAFIDREDWTSTMANVVQVAESFLSQECGLFSAPLEPRDVVDGLNVRMMEKKVNRLAVQVLTLGMNLRDLFDFYEELEYLTKECIRQNCGVPYPLEGFKSPTLFICRDPKGDCEHLEGSLKAVTIVKPLGLLQPGRYHRCWLLTPKLLAFYESHYKDIKKAAFEDGEKKKEA